MNINLSDLINNGPITDTTGNAAEILHIDKAVQSSYQVGASHEAISFGFDEELVVEAVRSGNDIILTLANGETIRLVNYFDFFPFEQALNFVGSEIATLAFPPLTAVVQPNGIWVIEPVDIEDGTQLSVSQHNSEGGQSDIVTETVDGATDIPTITTASSNDDTPLVLEGTAEAGAKVQVTVGGAVFEVTANEAGVWTLITETATPIEGTFTQLTAGTYRTPRNRCAW